MKKIELKKLTQKSKFQLFFQFFLIIKLFVIR